MLTRFDLHFFGLTRLCKLLDYFATPNRKLLKSVAAATYLQVLHRVVSRLQALCRSFISRLRTEKHWYAGVIQAAWERRREWLLHKQAIEVCRRMYWSEHCEREAVAIQAAARRYLHRGMLSERREQLAQLERASPTLQRAVRARLKKKEELARKMQASARGKFAKKAVHGKRLRRNPVLTFWRTDFSRYWRHHWR